VACSLADLLMYSFVVMPAADNPGAPGHDLDADQPAGADAARGYGPPRPIGGKGQSDLVAHGRDRRQGNSRLFMVLKTGHLGLSFLALIFPG
jgi:hypothetical protein